MQASPQRVARLTDKFSIYPVPRRVASRRLSQSKLWARLEAEQGTKELDLTHRLDSKGRLGRKIAFRDSELRYVELLEDFREDLPSARRS